LEAAAAGWPYTGALQLLWESKALLLDWLLNPAKSPTDRIDRILARLAHRAAHEADAHLADDYRQAMVAILLAARGSPIAFIESSYVCYGLHPDKVWPAILARREALLGPKANPQKGANAIPEAAVGLSQVRDSSMSGVVTGPGEARRESDGTGVGPIRSSRPAIPCPKKPVQSVRRQSGKRAA